MAEDFSKDSELPQEVVIKTAKDIPFGILSNDYYSPFVSKEKIWNTVTNYIFAHMVSTPLYRLILQVSPVFSSYSKKHKFEEKLNEYLTGVEQQRGMKLRDEEIKNITEKFREQFSLRDKSIYQLYEYFHDKEVNDTTYDALKQGYINLIENDSKLSELLLSTGTYPIVYISNDNVLGVNQETKQGLNFVGFILEQIRFKLRHTRDIKRQAEELKISNQEILDIYRAYTKLNELINKGIDILPYQNKTIDEINEELEDNSYIDEDSILSAYKNRQLSIISDYVLNKDETPNRLVVELRKQRMDDLENALINKRKLKAITIYTEQILKRTFPEENKQHLKNAALQLVFAAPSGEAYKKLTDTVYNLYITGELEKKDPSIAKKIGKALKKIKLYSSRSDSNPSEESNPSDSSGKSEDSENREDQSSSSYSNEAEGALKELLNVDEASERKYLLETLERYSGITKKKYKNLPIDELRTKVKKYIAKGGVSTTTWEIYIKHRNNRIELLGEESTPPTEEIKEQYLSEYNSKNNTNISSSQLFVKMKSSLPSNILNERKSSSNEEEVLETIHPEMIEIYDTDNVYAPLSPIYTHNLVIENSMRFPSVLLYMYFVLIVKSTYPYNVKNANIISKYLLHSSPLIEKFENIEQQEFKRKTGSEILRKIYDQFVSKLKVNENDFVSPDEAYNIYYNISEKNKKRMMISLARKAANLKFQNSNNRDVLLLTENRTIIYQSNNPILGTGFKNRGENEMGKILEKIRDYYHSQKIKYPPVRLYNMTHLLQDEFVNSWIDMKLRDICKVVYKLKIYLRDVARKGQEIEEIDDKFAENVLKTIYKSCINFHSTVKIPPPSDFIYKIYFCGGIQEQKGDRDYDTELSGINRSQIEEDYNFYSRLPLAKKESKTDLSLKDFLDYQQKELTKFLEGKHTVEEERDFRKRQLKELNSVIKKSTLPVTRPEWMEYARKHNKDPKAMMKVPIEIKQLVDWTEFNKELSQPELGEEAIEERMRRFEKKNPKPDRKEEDWMESEKEYNKKRAKLWADLHRPKYSATQYKSLVDEFVTKQEQELIDYYGIRTTNRSKDELQEHLKKMDEYKRRRAKLLSEKQAALEHRRLSIRKISEVYWRYIVGLLYYIVENLKNENLNEQNIRKILAYAEQINSKSRKCVSIGYKLDDETDNCIASALVNVLLSVQAFKYQYADDIPLLSEDIELATSIILNNTEGIGESSDEGLNKGLIKESDKELNKGLDKDSDRLVTTEEDVERSKGERSEMEERDENLDLSEEIEKAFEDFDIGDADEKEKEEREYDYGEDVYEDEEFGFSSRKTNFSFNKKKEEDREAVKQLLLQIGGVKIDVDPLINSFIDAINNIKESKLLDTIKRNRINFFANLV